MDDARDNGYVAGTPEYRVAIMWGITRDAWSFMKNGDAERRLQRNVTHLVRGGR